MKRFLVTGGTGFIGRSIVRLLIEEGNNVVVFDNDSRGSIDKLNIKSRNLKFIKGDIRDFKQVNAATKNINTIIHLAYINGTENFYKKSDLVLDIATKGIVNVIDAGKKNKVEELFFASSSEVYGEPTIIPTPENVPLIVSDPFNPRYSYSGGKIIGELMIINNSKFFNKVVVFRPHNVYGPAMGNEHVIPQFISKLKGMRGKKNIKFEIQGSGSESRSFIYIDDFAKAFGILLKKSKNLEIYNIGTMNEIKIEELALKIAELFGKEVKIEYKPLAKGSPRRRCPDVTKISRLGFKPETTIEKGLNETINWYIAN